MAGQKAEHICNGDSFKVQQFSAVICIHAKPDSCFSNCSRKSSKHLRPVVNPEKKHFSITLYSDFKLMEI
jgi:hypothetical protein